MREFALSGAMVGDIATVGAHYNSIFVRVFASEFPLVMEVAERL